MSTGLLFGSFDPFLFECTPMLFDKTQMFLSHEPYFPNVLIRFFEEDAKATSHEKTRNPVHWNQFQPVVCEDLATPSMKEKPLVEIRPQKVCG